jgi:hypothetical protein
MVEISGQFRADGYGVSRCLAAQQNEHLSNELVNIHKFSLRTPLLKENVYPADDFRRTGCILNDSRRGLAAFSTSG